MHGLHVQTGIAADLPGRVTARRHHVGGRVDTVDVEARLDPRHEQPPRATCHVQCRLSGLDERAEELDLGSGDVEARPPTGDEPVVPRHDIVIFVHNGMRSTIAALV